MADRYDEHLSFDLPYGYEAAVGVNDEGQRTFQILCGTGLNDEGETTSEMKLIFRRIDGALRDELRNLRGSLPACDFGRVSEISMGISLGTASGSRSSGRTLSIDLLIYIVAVGGDDGVYALIGTKISKEGAFDDNCEIVAKHMNAVLRSMTLDGKAPEIEHIDGSRVARTLRAGNATEDGDIAEAIRPLDNTKGMRIERPGKAETQAVQKPTPETKPEQKPEPEESPEEKARKAEEARLKAAENAKKEAAWKQWLSDCDKTKQRRAAAAERMKQQKLGELRADAGKARDEALRTLSEERKKAEAEKADAEKTLASLGVFKFAEKKQMKERIETLTTVTLPGLARREQEIGDKYQRDLAAVDDAIRREADTIKAEAERQHPLPEQPEKPDSVLEQERQEQARRESRYASMSAMQKKDEQLKRDVWDFLHENGAATISDMIEQAPGLEDETDLHLSAICRAMVLAGSLSKEVRLRRTYFCAVENARPYLPDSPKRTVASPLLTDSQKRNEMLKSEILTGLAEEGPMNITEMIERIPALEGQSEQYVSALCRALMFAGSVEKYTEARRTYFRIP